MDRFFGLNKDLLGESIEDEVWEAKREVASQLIELGEALYTVSPPDTGDLHKLAAALQMHSLQLRSLRQHQGKQAWIEDGGYSGEEMFGEIYPFTGLSSPVGPKITLLGKGEHTKGTCLIPLQYEGPPGMAHGGVIAGMFEQFLGSYLAYNGLYSVVERISVSFFAPAPLRTELDLQAKIASVQLPVVTVKGELRKDEALLASCEASWLIPGAKSKGA